MLREIEKDTVSLRIHAFLLLARRMEQERVV
jgi:hypothetical protein